MGPFSPRLRRMKCDQCDLEATVHEVTIRGGVKVERHLCQSCAASAGIAPGEPLNPADVLKLAVEASNMATFTGIPGTVPGPQPVGKRAKQVGCSHCGMTWDEFKSGGMLGCSRCYDEFESKLIPLIERAHEGASQHVGKAPARSVGKTESGRARELAALVEERAQRVAAMRRLLEEAIKGEQYERAAQLRDELRRLNEPGA